ncbi:head-tail adaptor protein [Brevundimonas sp. UBA5866]|uniref:head-tail adaptor protein n=1 Tax=Brevundimonas sp. UBA5866 TaxID=1946132 RepID=UPI0025C5D643|nr:head-tail adaptor protein [Brevundimonas sp. UBA5866]
MAGHLTNRVRFDSRAPDANGDPLGPFVEGFTVWADVEYLRGSEVALQHRLERRQPVSVTIRDSRQARTITPAMRMVDVRTGEVFNVTSASPARTPGYRNILAVSGGAEG